jgi:hypothetical protein
MRSGANGYKNSLAVVVYGLEKRMTPDIISKRERGCAKGTLFLLSYLTL